MDEKKHWVVLNYDYRTVLGHGTIREDGTVHIILQDPRIVDLVRHGEKYIAGLPITTEPAVEAQKDDEPKYRTWFSTPAGVYIILRNDHVIVDPQGQALVFYRKIDADRKLEEIKKGL